MPNYKWNCLVCNNENQAGSDYCPQCGCIDSPSAKMVEAWKNEGLERPGLDPKSLALFGEYGMVNVATFPCPSCGIHVYICSSKCWNCSKIYTAEERYFLVKNLRQQRRKSQLYGILFFGSIVLLTLLFSIE